MVGPSGAGKSTILNLVGGLDRASAGEVDVDGQDLGLLDDDDAHARTGPNASGSSGRARRAQPRALPHRARERAAARRPCTGAALRRRRDADELLALVGLGDRREHTAGHAVAAANSSVPRSPWHWPTRRRSCWPTSPRPSSTPRVSATRPGRVPRGEPGVRRDDRDGDPRPGGGAGGRPADPRARRAGPARGRWRSSRSASDGRVQLPDEAVAALGDGELEAEVSTDEVRLRRRSETGHA